MKINVLPLLLICILPFADRSKAVIPAPPCGTDLATYNGVAAKSNGEDQGTSDQWCAGSGTYGLQYQCVEYIKRYYKEALSIDTTSKVWKLNAVDFYKRASTLGLLTYVNSQSLVAPAPDDIIVFGSTKNNSYGHVAIVVNVSAGFVNCIEENWSGNGMAILQLGQQNGVYTINPRGAYKILGWLRSPPKEFVLQPGPDTGKDIWTTSVFSYAPNGGGPGGGLEDFELVVGGWGDLYYSLIQFDLSTLPKAAKSAQLQLYCFRQRGIGTTGLYLDRIAQFWDWRTQGTGSDHLRLWWADRPAAVQWIPQALAPPTVGDWYAIDITDLYNAWQSSTYQNYGLQLRPVSNNNQWAEFYSAEYTDPTYRPKLVVEP
jgi:hypothetical protein